MQYVGSGSVTTCRKICKQIVEQTSGEGLIYSSKDQDSAKKKTNNLFGLADMQLGIWVGIILECVRTIKKESVQFDTAVVVFLSKYNAWLKNSNFFSSFFGGKKISRKIFWIGNRLD